jgi:sugar lactone lactonase YvrE
MDRNIFRSKLLVAVVLLLFSALWAGEGFAQAAGQAQSEFAKAFEAGKKLYEDGEHKEAVIKFLQALNAAKEKAETGEACFYLSLSYYGLGDTENTALYMKKMFEAQPEREINARMFPSGYVVQFYRIKSDFAPQKPVKPEEKPKVEAKPDEKKTEPEKKALEEVKKPTAVPGKAAAEPQVKKKGGFPWLIVGGLVVAAGIVLYFVLGKKKDAGSNLGAISVVSTPAGAKVFLDGSDTGQTTACTLNNIAAGAHAVKLTKDGYADYQQNVTVTGGQTAAVNASMTANIIVVASPAAGTAGKIGTANDIRWQVDSGALAAALRAKSISRGREKPGESAGRSAILQERGESSSRTDRSGFVGGKRKEREESMAPAADPRLPFPSSSALQTDASLAIVKVKIELYKGGSLHSLIIAETDNSGVYSWPVSQPTVSGSDYKIRISCSTDSSVYGESAAFTLSTGTIFVSDPAAGSLWGQGTAHDIKWTSTATGNVKIELYKGTSALQTIVTDTPNDGSHNWTVPAALSDGTDYIIRISIVSNANVFGESQAFTIAGGSIIVTDPVTGSYWTRGLTYNIKWTSTISGNVKIELYKGASLFQTIATDAPNTGVQSWTLAPSLADGADYKIRISLISPPYTSGESGLFQIGTGSSYEFALKWGSPGTGDGQFNAPRGIAVDASGYVYVADTDSNRIQKFTGSGAFIAKWGIAGTGDGQVISPWGMTVDNAGFLYVIETGNNRVQKFTSTGSFVSKFGTPGTGDGQFNQPRWLAVDASGNIYVSDQMNYRIQKFNSSGAFLTKWGSQGIGDGQFNAPQGIAVDDSGNVYVAESDNARIQKFNSTGAFLAKWGSPGSGDSQFSQLRGMAIDSAANIYVADFSANRIQKLSSSGTFITKWGSSGTGDGQFSNSSGIAVDNSGNVYVTEMGGNRVQKFRPKAGAPLFILFERVFGPLAGQRNRGIN